MEVTHCHKASVGELTVTRSFVRLPAAIIALTSSTVAGSESMNDFWTQRAPIGSYSSDKSLLALEYCLGLAGSEDGTVTTLHGENITLVSIVVPNSIISTIMGFRIVKDEERRRVDVFGRGSTLGTWERHATRYVDGCV